MRTDIDASVAGLAARQHGVFSREQLVTLGATRFLVRRRVQAGAWEPVEPGVFRLRGSRSTWQQRVMTRCLSWDARAAASGRTAAALLQLAGFREGPIDVTVPPDNRRAGRPGNVFRRALRSEDVATVDGIAVTTAARTLVDLASSVSRDRLEVALDDALRRGLLSIAGLRRRLREEPGRRGNATIRSLLDAREGMALPGSPFETMLLRAIVDAGLPKPDTQYEIRIRGRSVFVDFAFPDHMVVVEADGYEHHSGRVRWDYDRKRRNDLTTAGWIVIQVTWTEFKRRPDAVIQAIRLALKLAPPASR